MRESLSHSKNKHWDLFCRTWRLIEGWIAYLVHNYIADTMVWWLIYFRAHLHTYWINEWIRCQAKGREQEDWRVSWSLSILHTYSFWEWNNKIAYCHKPVTVTRIANFFFFFLQRPKSKYFRLCRPHIDGVTSFFNNIFKM